MKRKYINADKPHLWKRDIAASIDQFNLWFLRFAPEAFRSTRLMTTQRVKDALVATNDLRQINPESLRNSPSSISTLRMCTSPPLAVDRLIGLAHSTKNLVGLMEKGKLPSKTTNLDLDIELAKLCEIIQKLLDDDIFPWLITATSPSSAQRERAATVVADRLCSAVANPIVRNAQEQRQLKLIEEWLTARGYRRQALPRGVRLEDMERGTFAFRMNIAVGKALRVNIPVDVAVRPISTRTSKFPILIEAKSAGDFTNTNKRRKEEATKVHQLRTALGDSVVFVLFLCGYFGSDYLGYEAAEGIDWVWEHRISDLAKLGL